MRIICAYLLAGIYLTVTVSAYAAQLSISPTRLSVTPESEAIAFSLRNGGDQKALVEVAVYTWTDINDPNALEPTKDFIVVPPVVEIPAKQAQVLRLAQRVSGDVKAEQMYRLILKEVPSAIRAENGVGFALEMSLPVFLAPQGASAKPVWSLRWKDVATPELLLANQGDAHLRVRSIELFDDPNGSPLYRNDESAYVLPSNEKVWPLGAELKSFKGPFTLKAETSNGTVERIVEFPDG